MKRGALFLVPLIVLACSPASDREGRPTSDELIIYEAASLTGPMRAAIDTFARRTGTHVLEEHGASLELARRVTELQRIPDVLALADHELFRELLIPSAASWYAIFARNRMVVAYTPRSRHATSVNADNWRSVLLRPEVLVGRADPVLAPAGYRALLMFQLAERFYHDPGLAARLEARTPSRLLRGNATELAALLSAGELDYIIEYESVARTQHLQFVRLPAAIDLGDPALASTYATASVRVGPAATGTTRYGAPILYGVTVPRGGRNAAAGIRFLAFLLGADGQAILRHGLVDMLDQPVLFGDSVPAELRGVHGSR